MSLEIFINLNCNANFCPLHFMNGDQKTNDHVTQMSVYGFYLKKEEATLPILLWIAPHVIGSRVNVTLSCSFA